MVTMQDLNTAIGAHAMWKLRLANAIANGTSEFVPERVEPDNLCDFGKWLYGLSVSERNSDQWKKVQALHAAFHKEASQILRLALRNQKAEAQKRMDYGGSFAKASTDLTLAMMDWKKTLGS